MAISVERFNGNDIQDSTFVGLLSLDAQPFARTGTQVQVQPPGAWPKHIRTNMQPRSFTLDIEIVGGDVNTGQRQLAQWFAAGTTGDLEINEDGVQKVITCTVVGAVRYAESMSRFQARMVAADPRFRAINPLSAAETLTASGQSFTVTNPGNAAIDDPVISLRPVANKAAASGYLYKLESIVAWRAERPSGNYAIDVTNGGWDHATEVGASRSQADGDDVRVLVDGVEVPRWLGEHANNDANSALTTVWVNLNYSPRRTATLLTAITLALPTADGEVVVTKGGTLGWPRQGAFRIDDEVITYTGKTESNADGNAAFTGVTRAARNTTAATHTATTVMYWIEHRIQIVYGNTGVSAPAARADLKPLLDFTAATPAALSNVIHTWINFADDTYPGRSMQWGRRNRTNDDQYTKILSPGGSPASSMTMEYQSSGAVAGKPNYNTWFRDLPTGSGSSGGNISSITRTIADTLGMWSYGVDNDGREVVLEKYAGALTSGSDTTTAPTNPVYRYEFWGFNQVIAKRQDPASAYSASAGLTNSLAGYAVQIITGSDPVDITGALLRVTDSTGGATVTCSLVGDQGDLVATTTIASATYTTTAAGSQLAAFTFSTPVPLRASTKYWLGFDDGAGATTSIYYAGIPYNLVYFTGSVVDAYAFDFAVLGRPSALAATYGRCDTISYADDSDQIVIDGVTIYLSATETPYVSLKARQAQYRFTPATLYNETTGQSITINAACALGAQLDIDIGAGTAINVDDEDGTPFAAGVEFSDPDTKFALAPGANSLRFVEAGLVGVTVEVAGTARWE